MKTLSAREAKNHFGEAMDTAQHEAVIITKHGRGTAALVSIAELAQIPRYSHLARPVEQGQSQTLAKPNFLHAFGAVTGVFKSPDEVDSYIKSERDKLD